MKKAYTIIRGLSYACGISALLLILLSRGGTGEHTETILLIGYTLVAAMFLLFCVSYVLFILMRQRR